MSCSRANGTMTDPIPDSATDTTTSSNGTRAWNGVAAVIAALIGVLALLVSAYTAYVQRQQVRAQVWPYVELGESDSLPNDVVGAESHGGLLVAINKGTGPAIVQSVVVRVDQKPQRDWRHAFAALGFSASEPYGMSSLNHSVLSPGERLDFLTIVGKKEWSNFKSKLGSDIVVRACYCSTLGECWTSAVGFYTKRRWGQSVDSCSIISESEQFED